MRDICAVLDDLTAARQKYPYVNRIFIADGDALIRGMDDWIRLLNSIGLIFPECSRVSCYASARSILDKSADELARLQELGLSMLYLGLESGSDKVLRSMNKGETVEQIVEAVKKAKECGMKLSVTAISGLGGRALWEEHAVHTGEALSRMKPDYIGLLTLMLSENAPLHTQVAAGKFEVPGPMEITAETLLMLNHLDSEGSVFRSNHASNYLALKGTLNVDIEPMKQLLREALAGKVVYKNEWSRRL